MIMFKDVSLRRLIDKNEKLDTRFQTFFDSIKEIETINPSTPANLNEIKLEFLKELLTAKYFDEDIIGQDFIKMRLLAVLEKEASQINRKPSNFRRNINSYFNFGRFYKFSIRDFSDNEQVSNIKSQFSNNSKVIMYTYHSDTFSFLENAQDGYNSEIFLSSIPLTADITILTADTTRVRTNDSYLLEGMLYEESIENDYQYLQSLVFNDNSTSLSTDSKSKLISNYRNTRDSRFTKGINDRENLVINSPVIKSTIKTTPSYSQKDITDNLYFNYTYQGNLFTSNVIELFNFRTRILEKLNYENKVNTQLNELNIDNSNIVTEESILQFMLSINIMNKWSLLW